MCIEINRLVLCTCESKKEVFELDKFWVFLRKKKKVTTFTLGSVVEQNYLSKESFIKSLEQITLSLNSGNVFDKPLEVSETDRLLLYIKPDEVSDHWVFTFKYSNGKWDSTKLDPFEANDYYRTFRFGKVQF